MIKKLILAFLILFPSMAFAQKFGVVNTESVVSALPEFKEMQASYEASAKKLQDEFDNLREKFQKELNELQAMPEDTPTSIRERRTQEVQELDQKIQQFSLNAQNELQQTQQRLLQPIMERVRTAIQTVGQEGNFTMIFENTLPVYTGTDAIDVTAQVRTKLGI